MLKHLWKESRFDNNGFFEGNYTCMQSWKCKTCNQEVALPLGTKPDDYGETPCKRIENVYRCDPPPKEKWQHPIKGVSK